MKNRRIKIISVLCFVMLAIIITNMALYASATPAQQENNMVLDSSKPTEWIPNKDINTKGDLSLEELKTAVLKSEDIPEFITDEHISKNGHAHRLYQQEEDLNTVVFQNRDGSKTAYVFDEQIKYRDKNGNVRDRSTALTREQNGYRMKDNIVTLFMPNDISTGISLGVDNINITMTPYTFDKKAKVTHSINENDEVTYYGVFGSKTSVKYTPLLSGVKEDIILEEYTGTDSFSFLLTTNGYSVIQSFGKYYLSDPLTGEICGSFGDVIIYDAAGNTATGCMTLKDIETDNKYILTIHADRSFLTSETTQYPVTIDPTFEMTNNLTAANILDATVYSTETSGYHGGSTTLKVGIDSQLGAGRMYFRFPRILNNYAVTNQYYNVTRVELYLYNNSSNTTENTLLIHKHAGEGNWTEVEATCLTIGYHDIGTMLGSTVVSATNQYYSFDITEAFNSWKTNSDEFAKGIMIRAQNLSSAEYAKTFASTESDTNKPYVVFTYTDLTPMVCMYHGNLVLECGEEYTAKATLWIGENIVPSTGQITFTSSKTDIATIDSSSGLIHAKNPGTTIITARYNDTNISCQITLSVTQTTSGEDETAYISLPVRTITLNNDSNRNSDRSYTISPEFHYNGSVVEATFTYTAQLVDSLYEDFYPVHVGVSTDGFIEINTPYSDSMEMAHPTGSFTVEIYGEAKVNGTTVVATTTLLVNVICEDMPLPGYSSTNPLVDGRYVKILYGTINIDNGVLFNDLMDEWQLSCDKRYVNFTAQGSDYIELDGQNFDITFFEMMRSSKIFVITTHGTSTSISVSGIDENLKITCDQRFPNGYQGASSQPNKNDILTLHNGYFGYCDLVIYTLCDGSNIYDNKCNLMEITHMKGAKTVVGFKTEVDEEEAGDFQDALFKLFMPNLDENEGEDDEYIETHNNLTIESAVLRACSKSGVSSTIVKISGDATIKIREYMEESQ